MGYHQVRLDEDAIPKTAFKKKYGSFEFTLLPSCLTNAPCLFMCTMNETFSGFIDKFKIVYLDDILIYSKTSSEHLSHIRKVLERLREKKPYETIKKVSVWSRRG